jgi:pyruvate kinase
MSKPKKEFLLSKIVSTLGPASAKESVVEQLIKEGVGVFRINFSHGTFDEYESLLNLVRRASKKLNIPIAVLGDLSGPKIRVGKVVEGGVDLKVGQQVAFQKEPIETQNSASGMVTFSTTYTNLCDEVTPGETIMLNDGFVRLTCQEKREGRLICLVEQGGIISSSKGVNLPDTDLSVPALTEKDITCVKFAVEKGFDYLALSFVRKADDVKQLKELLRQYGARTIDRSPFSQIELSVGEIKDQVERTIPVISKIEKPQAVENLEEILRETDAIMVARGDLGVEMDLAEVAVTQKRIIKLCREYGIPCIVATQMLESMIESPTPTRAEVSDVANAIFDGADAVMLSGETAVGKYPVETVRMMNRIAERSNAFLKTEPLAPLALLKSSDRYSRIAALSKSVYTVVKEMDAKFIIVWSHLGGEAVYLSQQRSPRPILYFSPYESALRKTALLYGIEPIYMPSQTSNSGFFQSVDKWLLEHQWAQKGDTVVFIVSEPITQTKVTNEMVIHSVGEQI